MEMNGTTVIRRPAEAVFDYVSDPSNDANWRTGIVESGWQSGAPDTPGAIGYTLVGSQKAVWRMLSYIPGESADWEFVSGPLKGRGGYRLAPVDGGTKFTLVADVKPAGWLRVLGPVYAWLVRRLNQRDVEKLSDILESMPVDESQEWDTSR
jgi:hypothetical protein